MGTHCRARNGNLLLCENCAVGAQSNGLSRTHHSTLLALIHPLEDGNFKVTFLWVAQTPSITTLPGLMPTSLSFWPISANATNHESTAPSMDNDPVEDLEEVLPITRHSRSLGLSTQLCLSCPLSTSGDCPLPPSTQKVRSETTRSSILHCGETLRAWDKE